MRRRAPRRRRRTHRSFGAPLMAASAAGLAALAGIALTAANVVAASRVDLENAAVNANQMAPTPCSGLVLATVIVGNNGDAQANLLIGSPGVDTMNGRQANDCVVGGGGNDVLLGGAGVDVCIGGPGADTFAGNCETQIQ